MKTLRLIFTGLMLVALVGFVSSAKAAGEITVNPKAVVADSVGLTINIQVTAPAGVNWQVLILSGNGWVHFDQMNGIGNDVIQLTVDSNLADKLRWASIIVRDVTSPPPPPPFGVKEAHLRVTQLPY
jgi:hypothetical protein